MEIIPRHERGNIKIRNNKLNAAINDFRKAEKTKSNSASLYLAQTYSLLNNLDSAIFFLDKYVHYYDKKPMPDIVLDSAFYSINKTNEWKAFWLEDYYTNVEKMMQNVKYNYKHHQVALALIEVNDIIKKYKTYHKAYFLKAKILFDGGNYQKAKKFTSKAIKISPLQSDYFLLRAETYMKLKKYNNAADDFMQSLKINPYQPKVYLLLAESQYKNKKYTDAVISINKYTDAFYKHYDAFFFEALINFDAGNYLTSIKILNILLASDSNNSKYLSLRGKSYLNTHSYKLAYNDFNICLDINPKLTDTYFYRGLAEFEMNMTDAACADWKRAIKYKDYKANDYYYEYCKDFDRNNH